MPIAVGALLLLLSGRGVLRGDDALEFNRDIRPILAETCLPCHGPDRLHREADLRLDDRDSALTDRDGKAAIVPGAPDSSELIRRITSTDPDVRMPPPSAERQLTGEQIDRLRQWIAAGAPYQRHWAFLPPERPDLPNVARSEWVRNPIDRFVLARLEREGLSPAEEAERATLIRRVTLDLTGLPPTPAEVDAFLADDKPGAYERVVDRLLQSPRYGERMAQVWLDAGRFADSGGYQGDILRSMWLWRDWVIDAYNANQPFDEFTIEQLAGDLLPSPTRAQRIATGFHRNHRINDEDGIILEEFRVEYVADRVETTATVWLGLTLGCARCHDHKYDPFSQEEYYRLFAYFNSIDEQGRGHGNAPPLLSVPSPAQESQLEELAKQLADRQAALDRLTESPETPESDQQEPRKQLQDEIAALQKTLEQVRKQVPTVMVLQERAEPRTTHILTRGAYNRPGREVTAGTPEVLAAGTEVRPANRLGLSQWLTDPRHPLTARVAVNRYWQMYFGRGLVATAEDFGTQGALPSHPQLLDWLATEFVRTGWDVKRMQRLIVTSATYRQSSAGTAELLERDPENRLLARGPRFRLDAERIRDQALSASGLLVERLGGPSVRPYQPEGLWYELTSNARDYQQGTGADLYRRSLYTFVRRTVPPPAMATLDAPNRELCAVRRPRTNTPLQALTLMNDPTYVEAARALAATVLRENPESPTEQFTAAFRRVLARRPTPIERKVLTASLQHYTQRYSDDEAAARELLSIGESPLPAEIEPRRLAALTSVCMILLNLDETVTKE